MALIIAIDAEALEALAVLSPKNFPGSLNLSACDFPLPNSLQSIGGYLNVEGYQHPLPKNLKVRGRVYK